MIKQVSYHVQQFTLFTVGSGVDRCSDNVMMSTKPTANYEIPNWMAFTNKFHHSD